MKEIERYKTHLISRGLSPCTIKAFVTDVCQFSTYSPTLTPESVGEWLSHLKDRGLTNKTIARKATAIAGFFRFLNRAVIIPPIKTEKRLPKALSEIEAKALLETASNSERNRLIVELLLYCGVRSSELLNIRKRDISEQPNLFYLNVEQGKGNKDRRIPIPNKRLQKTIKRYIKNLENDDLLFPMGGRNLRRLIKLLGAKSGLGNQLHPHLLRHTAATMYLRKGANIESVRRVLGHESLLTTQKYLALTDEDIAHDIHKANW